MWNPKRWKRLAGIFGLFFLLFNYPLVTIFEQGEDTVMGIPRLYFFFFLLWFTMILMMAWHIERPGRNS